MYSYCSTRLCSLYRDLGDLLQSSSKGICWGFVIFFTLVEISPSYALP
uniref:Uncharacterized protein n=1 Tax=Rhizophora mucronata TaxID=61149 RepID=A0A2P2Q449_RHIMU